MHIVYLYISLVQDLKYNLFQICSKFEKLHLFLFSFVLINFTFILIYNMGTDKNEYFCKWLPTCANVAQMTRNINKLNEVYVRFRSGHINQTKELRWKPKPNLNNNVLLAIVKNK